MNTPGIPPGRMLLPFSPGLPYVRKVMTAAQEMGLAERPHCVRTVVGGTTPPRELMQDDPAGENPDLGADGRDDYHDSPVVCEYLGHTACGPEAAPLWIDLRPRRRPPARPGG